jgi:hypothetical protein
VDYRTNHNVIDRALRGEPLRVDSVPAGRSGRSSLEGMVRREEEVRVAGYRVGYVHHDWRWRDDFFAYPFYGFRWDARHFVVSPWYLYWHLPPYICSRRVTFVYGAPFVELRDWHDWSFRDRFDRRSPTFAVDTAVADLVRAFERRDLRALGRLVPRHEHVVITAGNGDRYRIGSDDFYDMMVDLIRETRTRDYRVLEVRRGRTTVQVVARHEFEDTWGRRTAVFHEYVLEWDGRDYSIVEFATTGARR